MLATNLDLTAEAKDLVLKELQSRDHAMSLHDIIGLLSENGVVDSKRIAKETAWDLVGEGKAQFTNNWSIVSRV